MYCILIQYSQFILLLSIPYAIVANCYFAVALAAPRAPRPEGRLSGTRGTQRCTKALLELCSSLCQVNNGLLVDRYTSEGSALYVYYICHIHTGSMDLRDCCSLESGAPSSPFSRFSFNVFCREALIIVLHSREVLIVLQQEA